VFIRLENKLNLLLIVWVFPAFLFAQTVEEKQLKAYITTKRFIEAANFYQANQLVDYSTQSHKEMMLVCKEVGKPALAIAICKKELLKNPQASFWHIREMQFLIYDRQIEAAAKKIALINEKNSNDFAEIYDMLLREQENWVELLSQSLNKFQVTRNNPSIIDEILFCFYKLKAGTAAQNWVVKQQINFSPLQRFYLFGANANMYMKWSTEVARSADERIGFGEKALKYIDSALQLPAIHKADRTYLAYDRVLALTAAAQYDSALAYAKQLQEPIPTYVTIALAKAALETRKSADAETLYRKVFIADTNNREAINGLSFSLSDQEKHGANITFLKSVIDKQPVWVRDAETGNKVYNPVLQSTQIQLARSYSYAGYQDRALALINQEISNDPLNIGLYQIRGNIFAASGLYTSALENYSLTLAEDKNNAGLLYSIAGSRFRKYQFNQFTTIIQTLNRHFPLSPETKRMNKEWKEFNSTEVYLSYDYSNVSGPVQQGDGYRYQLHWYTPPIALHWRLAGSYQREWVDIPEGQVMFTRYGVGVEYRKNNIELIAMLTGNRFIEHNIGASLKAVFMPDDHQRMGVTVEKLSRETPLRGVFFQVYADRLGADYSYRWNEKTSVAAAVNYFLFTDQNRRIAANANLKQQLYGKPHFRINAIAGLYTSANTISNATYFNPKNDFSTDIQLNFQHTIYRKFEFNYLHQLTITTNRYKQYNFAPGYVGNFKYEQTIDLNYTKSIGWSFTKGERLYDGIKEPFLFFEINFHGRF
jgi:biofilm PGA synthesis protein PgaA